jgi:hypothetical protein
MKRSLEQKIGNKYGNLTILSVIRRKRPNLTLLLCKCICGNEKAIDAGNMVSGGITSCGCKHRDKVTKHKGTYTRLYRIWTNMKNRCNNPKAQAAKYYHDRGIKVCEEWSSDFTVFKK